MRFLHPLIGLEAGWTAPGKYDWTQYDKYFAKFLELVPDALLFPRIHLYAPVWWKETHPEELIKCGLPVPAKEYKVPPQWVDREAGLNWSLNDPYGASFASEIWKTRDGGHASKFPETHRSFSFESQNHGIPRLRDAHRRVALPRLPVVS